MRESGEKPVSGEGGQGVELRLKYKIYNVDELSELVLMTPAAACEFPVALRTPPAALPLSACRDMITMKMPQPARRKSEPSSSLQRA